MGDVVALNHSASLDYGEPDPDTIEKLEWLLAEARSGKLRGMVYGAADCERSLIYGHCGSVDSHLMVAAAVKVFNYVMSCDASNWE